MARSAKYFIEGDASGVKRATKEADRSLDRLSTATKKTGSAFSKFGGVMGLSTGAGVIGGLGLFTKNALDAASSAAEVDSKLQVVYGKSLPKVAKQLEEFSKHTAASNTELRQQAADMQALLGPMLKNEKASGALSVKMVKLATDLGSFNNVPTADALEALRAGLVGEAEPMRKFGVLLSESAVKAEALASGLVKPTKNMLDVKLATDKVTLAQHAFTDAVVKHGPESDEALQKSGALEAANRRLAKATAGTVDALTDQQKIQARTNIIMRETSKAHGDATRTAKSTANQVKELKSNYQDLSVKLGTVLLPVFNDVLKVTNRTVTALGENLPEAIDDLKGKLDAAQKAWDDFGGPIRTANSALGGIQNHLVWLGTNANKVFSKIGGWANMWTILLGPVGAVARQLLMVKSVLEWLNQYKPDIDFPSLPGWLNPGNLGRIGRASGGYVPGRGSGDTVPAMLTPGEVVLNARQQRMLGPQAIASTLAATGGVMGGRRFATGGVATLVNPALSFARAQLGDAYGRPDRYPPRSRLGPDTWDCSGFAGVVASKVPRYAGGIGGTTMTYGPAARTRAKPGDPIAWGFRGGYGGNNAHMGVRVLGRWFDAGSGGVESNQADSSWSEIKIPPGLEYLSSVQTVGKDLKAAKQGPRQHKLHVPPPSLAQKGANSQKNAAGDQSLGVYGAQIAAPVTTGAYTEDARGRPGRGQAVVGYAPQPGPAAVVPETVTDSTPVEVVPATETGPSAEDTAMRDRLLQLMAIQTRSDATNRAYGNTMGASNDLFGGMGMMLLGDTRSLSAWADQTSKSLYTQGAISPGRVGIGV